MNYNLYKSSKEVKFRNDNELYCSDFMIVFDIVLYVLLIIIFSVLLLKGERYNYLDVTQILIFFCSLLVVLHRINPSIFFRYLCMDNEILKSHKIYDTVKGRYKKQFKIGDRLQFGYRNDNEFYLPCDCDVDSITGTMYYRNYLLGIDDYIKIKSSQKLYRGSWIKCTKGSSIDCVCNSIDPEIFKLYK